MKIKQMAKYDSNMIVYT